jgi:hypothetical protein
MRGAASLNKKYLRGKAPPFRTSGGTAATQSQILIKSFKGVSSGAVLQIKV